MIKNNYAFIDSNNLYLGISGDIINGKGQKIYSGWKLDYKRFRVYLRDKYGIEKAFYLLVLSRAIKQCIRSCRKTVISAFLNQLYY